MKRSEYLIKDFDDDMKNKIRELAKDLATYKNKPVEKVYEELLFPQMYHPQTIEDHKKWGIGK
jgi:hypothetical protein